MERRRLPLLAGAAVLLVPAAWLGMQGGGPSADAPDRPARPLEWPTEEFGERDPEVRGEREVATPAAEGTARTVATHRILGRVVDERRVPVAGAEVRLGQAPHRQVGAISAGGGRFELLATLAEGSAQWRDSVQARDGQGRSAINVLTLPITKEGELLEVDAQTLVLLPAHALGVRVRDGVSPAAGSAVRVLVGHTRLPFGVHETDAQGRLELFDLPPGPVHLTASLGALAGRARAFVPEERAATIELEPLWGVEVWVVDAVSGVGIAGAELDVEEPICVPAALPLDGPRWTSDEYFTAAEWQGSVEETNEAGRARIEGLTVGAWYELAVRAEGFEPCPERGGSGPYLMSGDEPMRVELKPFPTRRVTWPVVDGEAPVPASGTPIRLRYRAGSFARGQEPPLPAPGWMEGATLVVDGVSGQCSFIAQALDGALAHLWVDADADLGNRTSFRRPRRIEVLVREGDGRPVVGARVGAHNQGNNPLCELVATSADGLAVLDGLYGGMAEVSVAVAGQTDRYGPTYGTIDLEKGDGRLEVTYEGRKRWRARLVLRVDGVPRLPARFQVKSANGVEVLEESPERGELVLEFALLDVPPSASIWLEASGFIGASAKFEFTHEAEEPLVHLDLARGGNLVAWVQGWASDLVSLYLQRFDEERQVWAAAPELGLYNGNGRNFPNGPRDSFVFTGLSPGHWRVFDKESGSASTEAELRVGDSEAHVELDLSSSEWVSGRVELEDPGELSRVRVLVERAGSKAVDVWRPGAQPPEGASLREGEFRLRVPGDEEVNIVAWHPWLVPAADSGRLRLRGGRDGVVLRLVVGDELRLPAPQLTGRFDELRVARFAAVVEPEGEPLEWHHAALVDGMLRCSLPRGEWALFVEPGWNFAPLVLPDVAIAGVTELPEARFTQGSTLRVRVRAAAGSDAPRIYVLLERIGAPVYHRSINSSGEREALVPGLGPGRYRVRMHAIKTFGQSLEQELEVDGVNEFELEFDLRPR